MGLLNREGLELILTETACMGHKAMRKMGSKLLAGCKAIARRLNPLRVLQVRVGRQRRDAVDEMLAQFSSNSERSFQGTVLVDGTWDNPNHWVRYALLRKALGLSCAREIGLVGPFRVEECSRTFSKIGVREVVNFRALMGDFDNYQAEAKRLLSETKTAGDILSWKLPHGFPPDFFYDGLLKRQRAACVNLEDPRLSHYVSEGLASIAAAEQVLQSYDFKLVALSHAMNIHYVALSWFALLRRIPVLVLYGEFGVLRFVKLNLPEDLWSASNRPEKSDYDSLPEERAVAMASAGLAYLEKRRRGETKEIASIYAYHKRVEPVTRLELCKQFGWDPTRPIIAVYAANWFDYPHPYGMRHFRDFLDWLEATLGVANMNCNVQWLFKAHPCDDWYGGVTLSDLMPAKHLPHIQQALKVWNGAALMGAVDGLVTYHGTAGIEFSAFGKPVLLADKGWYHELGIARWSRSRDEYLQALSSEWWKDLNLSETARRAQLMAGWHFCHPKWQKGFVLEEDTVQWPIYERLHPLLQGGGDAVAKELTMIQEWFDSESRHYHTFKMAKSEEFSS